MVAVNLSEGDRIAGGIFDACAARAEAEPRRRYLGMSQVGRQCALRLWLELYADVPRRVEGRMARVFDMGHSVEARVIGDLRLVYAVDGEQEEFSDFGGRFMGHCDGIVHGVTSRPHVLEVKSANRTSFEMFRRKGIAGRAEYAAQVQCYMGYSGLERALFVVESKDNQDLYVERVRFDRKAFEALRARAWSILTARVPPPRDRSGGDCRFCPAAGLCEGIEEGAPACGTCARFVPEEALRERGVRIEGDLCVLRKAPASRAGRCEEHEPLA
ncbi:MAG: hypothetical protein LBW85_01450 [Deltaproteobacteria bacterium]|jgi:hypothetical protein|nr:hypothetical protein [Deltaproteobacteria bacterium]